MYSESNVCERGMDIICVVYSHEACIYVAKGMAKP